MPAADRPCCHVFAKLREYLRWIRVPAASLNVLLGRRIAPSSSARCARYLRTDGFSLSIVPLLVMNAIIPPGCTLSMVSGKKVVMDQEVILVVSLVHNLKRAKRYITKGGIKKAVRQVRFLEPANSDRRFLISLLCNSSADAVQLYTIDFRVGQLTRTHADEIANTAGRLHRLPRWNPSLSKT